MRRVTKENLIAQIDRLRKIKDEQGQLSMSSEYTLQAYEMLLATIEAEPVAFIAKYESGAIHGTCDRDDPVKMEWLKRGMDVSPLYAAPQLPQPASVVPDAATAIRACMSEFPESVRDIVEECADIAENACRAAMLNRK